MTLQLSIQITLPGLRIPTWLAELETVHVYPAEISNEYTRPPPVSPSALSPPNQPYLEAAGAGGSCWGLHSRGQTNETFKFKVWTGERVRALINNHCVVSLPQSLPQSGHQTRVGE